MVEKVNPSYPDKVADRIARAVVDLAYRLEETPKGVVEALIGHGYCKIMMETSLADETVSDIPCKAGFVPFLCAKALSFQGSSHQMVWEV